MLDCEGSKIEGGLLFCRELSDPDIVESVVVIMCFALLSVRLDRFDWIVCCDCASWID